MKTKQVPKRIANKPKVKIGASRQVAIPKKIYDELRLSTGDYLEIRVERDHLVLTPQAFIEKRLAEGLADIRAGRVHGPFDTADDLIKSLEK